MAKYYLASLAELEKNVDLVGEKTLAMRYQQVAESCKFVMTYFHRGRFFSYTQIKIMVQVYMSICR